MNAAVKLDPIDVVGKKYKVKNYLDEKHPPRDFYSHIKPEIDDAMTKTFTFDILFHNSEHQATLLRYGVKKSEQVRNPFFNNDTMPDMLYMLLCGKQSLCFVFKLQYRTPLVYRD